MEIMGTKDNVNVINLYNKKMCSIPKIDRYRRRDEEVNENTHGLSFQR